MSPEGAGQANEGIDMLLNAEKNWSDYNYSLMFSKILDFLN